MKVKILNFFMILCSGFVLSCAEMKVERGVQNNIFYSSANPKIKIEINPDFKYIDDIEGTYYLEYEWQFGGSKVDKVIYLFGIIGNNKILERGIVIRIYTMRWGYWLPDLFANTKYKLNSGFVKISKERYQYAVFPSTERYGDVEVYLFDKGVKVPNCCIVKSIARIVGNDKGSFVIIDYIEDINFNRDRKYSCKEWREVNQLSDDQKVYLKQFLDRSKKNIKILNQ
jgi:hypothetical protein